MFIEKYKVTIKNWLYAFLVPRPVIGIFYLPRYIKHYRAYNRTSSGECIDLVDSHPCLLDWTISTPFDGHYFYQGAWLARLIAERKPDLHIDIGSSIMMISTLSAMAKTIFVDYRPLHVNLSGLVSVGANITNLPFQDDSADSLSCQHVIEHIGLGRYGDPIDPQGSVKAAGELERVLKRGGNLYLSLPVGRERVCFNAHRVHAPDTVVKLFKNLKLMEFSYVTDSGKFLENQPVEDALACDYACGMYIFEK